jgi:hypothetical protein
VTRNTRIRNPGDLVVASNLANFMLHATCSGANPEYRRSAALIARKLWRGVHALPKHRRQSIENLVRSHVQRGQERRANPAPKVPEPKTSRKPSRKPGQKLTAEARAQVERTIARWLYTPVTLRDVPNLALVANELGISRSVAYRIASFLR